MLFAISFWLLSLSFGAAWQFLAFPVTSLFNPMMKICQVGRKLSLNQLEANSCSVSKGDYPAAEKLFILLA